MSLTSSGSAGGPNQVVVCCNGGPSGGGGALFLKDSGAALNSLVMNDSGTALRGRTFHMHLCLTLQSHTRKTQGITNTFHLRSVTEDLKPLC